MSRHGVLAVGCALVGFLLVLALRAAPADPESRLPQRFRLAGLITREQRAADRLRTDAARLRADVERARRTAAGRQSQAVTVDRSLRAARLVAGLAAVEGPALRVTLDDSALDESPSGNINDLVIHSQDVQAVVNALWRAGAEAMGINGERLVSTSAVLCVGNTLLLNGTVHSPPYVVTAIGAGRARFDDDQLVRRLHDDADAFGLRFSVSHEDHAEVPAFDGAVALRFATRSG